MQIVEVQFDLDLIRGPLPASGDGTRTAGLHISDIYHDIESTMAPREAMESEQLNTYRAMGFIWEKVIEQGMAASMVSDRYIRPGEFTKDGIIGSPDLVDIQEWRVIDTKATWRSARKLDHMEKFFWIWLVQLKGYCAMVGTQEAGLLVFCVNGNWKPPMPTTRAFNLKFSQYEINENWNMIKNQARRRGWLK